MLLHSTLYRSFFFLFLPCFVLAQQPYMRQITDEDGLPSLTVYDLYQDDKDYVWIGTDKGLCRYDGQNFKYYYNSEKEQNAITHIFTDSSGRIWCSNALKQLFYLEAEHLTLFRPLEKIRQQQLILDYAFGQNAELWILTEEALLEYDLNKKKRLADKTLINDVGYQDLEVDLDNQLWLSSKQQLLLIKGKQSESIPLQNLDLQQPFQLCLSNESPYLIQQQAGEQNAQIYQYHDGKIKQFVKDLKLLPKGLLEDQEDVLWIYGFGGLFRKDKSSPSSQKIIDRIAVSKVLEDREGNHWISTLGGGIYFMPQPKIRYFSHNNSKLEVTNIRHLALNQNGHIILGTNGQQHPIFDPQEEKQNAFYQSPSISTLNAMYWDEKQKSLFLQQQQLYRFDEQTKLVASIPFDNLINEIHAYDEEHLLLATEEGLVILRKDFGSLQEDILTQLSSPKLFLQGKAALVFPKRNCQQVFVEKKNQIWVAYSDSLFLCELNQCQDILDKNENPIRVRDIAQTEDKTIWLATVSQGLLGLQSGRVRFSFNRNNGLKSTHINSLAVDGNNLWLGTDQGIQHLNSNRQSFSTYDKQDGLVSNEINALLILDDEVWAASPKGLINFKQNLSSINAYPPPIYLQNFVVNGEKQELNSLYQLSYHQNNISIGFQGIAYRAMQNFRYKYRLKGFSDVWYYIEGNQDALRFSALSPGRYVFEIRALNEDGVLSTEPLKISFIILPPFWQQWWFIAAIVAIIAILVSSLLWWRVLIRQRFLGRINSLKMKALQAQMNPHFVFNALNAIQTLMLTDDLEAAISYLSKFSKLIRSIFNTSNLPSIDLNEEVNFLKLYTDLEKLRFGDKVKIEFKVSEELLASEYFIPPLIIQPIIENSFKHGLLHKKEKGHLSITLQKEGEFLYVRIEDDGIGRDKAKIVNKWKITEQKQNSGLSVTTSRLALLKKYDQNTENPKITDLFGEDGQASGTRVELWIPFQQAPATN